MRIAVITLLTMLSGLSVYFWHSQRNANLFLDYNQEVRFLLGKILEESCPTVEDVVISAESIGLQYEIIRGSETNDEAITGVKVQIEPIVPFSKDEGRTLFTPNSETGCTIPKF